jgi:PAS domain S-box-containing protein
VAASWRKFLGQSLLEEREGVRIGRALFVVSVLGASLLLAVAFWNESPSTRAGIALFLAALALSFWLDRSGRPAAARLLIALMVLLSTTWALYVGHGIHDIAALFYPIIVIFAGLLLGKWAAVAFAVLCAVSVTAIVVAEEKGWFVTAFSTATDYSDAATVTVMLGVSAALLWFVMDSLGRSLSTLRASELALAEANRRLEDQTESLRASEARWRSLVENAPDRILNVTRDGAIASIDPAAGEGAPALHGSVYDLIPESEHPTLRGAIERAFEGVEPASCEVRGSAADRWYSMRLGPIEKDGAVTSLTLILTEVSEHKRAEEQRRRLEEQLREAQKMEALGQLAGGIAHDFNNLLTVISGHTSLLEPELPEGPAKESLDQIQISQERAAVLTRQLLAFGRRQLLRPCVLDLNATLTAVGDMLHRLVGENIELELALSEELEPVRADPGQIEQVILNLVLNARDAMPEGGRLELRTRRHVSADPFHVGGASIEAGRYAVLSVSDDGCGMDVETRAQIFEPFFTTKPHGKGTGLGLSSVYGIVKQGGGHIAVESEPLRGTTISIYQPAIDEGIESGIAAAEPERPEPGAETLLLVEDNEPMRRLLQRVLGRLGYTVLAARDGAEALRMAGEGAERIDLLLTDLVMPGMSGRTLAERFRETHGPVPVLYMSGYADDVLGSDGGLDDGVDFIQKPFAPQDLARKLREILDA